MDCVLLKTVFGSKLDNNMTLKQAINLLQSMELINMGELTELAISKKSGVGLCERNTPNIDTVTGKQIKYATVRKSPSNRCYKAHISRNTDAPILCVITNPVQNEQYFLHIPYKAHAHLTGNTLSLSFGYDGIPSYGQWWAYEVDSFEELCKLAK